MLPDKEELNRLNALMTQSTIKEASEAAFRREQAENQRRLYGDRNRASLQNTVLTQAMKNSGGPFKGTSLEAQMLNILLDPNIPDDDQRKIAATQFLGKEKTVATPDGTYITPSYDVGAIRGESQEKPKTTFVPKPPVESEKRARFSLGNMRELEARANSYVPSFTESVVSEVAPESVVQLMASPDFKKFQNVADEWARNLVFLRSGATARDDEVQAAIRNYFPAVGDGPEEIQRKAEMRADAVKKAEEAYYRRLNGDEGSSGNRTLTFDPATGEFR